MANRIRIAALLATLLVGTSAVAVAETTQTTGGVTILRGSTTPPSGVVGPGTGDSGTSAPGRGNAIDQSGSFNALHTGSSSAGGEIANPPPGAGR